MHPVLRCVAHQPWPLPSGPWVMTVNPYIEYYADNLPERRLGAFGIELILCGFALQYWLALCDVRPT